MKSRWTNGDCPALECIPLSGRVSVHTGTHGPRAMAGTCPLPVKLTSFVSSWEQGLPKAPPSGSLPLCTHGVTSSARQGTPYAVQRAVRGVRLYA